MQVLQRLGAALHNPALSIGLPLTFAIAVWGLLDSQGLRAWAEIIVARQFQARSWFIMLTVSTMLIAAVIIALSSAGRIRLGPDASRPAYSTASWLAMLFAAGMGVGLLFWGAAEPLSHFAQARAHMDTSVAADLALRKTIFHWGLHAWGVYAMTGLVIAYFVHRLGSAMLLSEPLRLALGPAPWVRWVGEGINTLAIAAIAIGLAGSIAMGVFQLSAGLISFGLPAAGTGAALTLLALTVAGYMAPLLVDLSRGMALLSNIAMAIAGGLMIFVLVAGPTSFLMNAMTEQFGSYSTGALVDGFKTYTFFDGEMTDWFHDWTLTYMVWWLAWSPFVGVFIARISRGRTIREFVLGVLLVPTVFSLAWFGTFGGAGFHAVLRGNDRLLGQARTDPGAVTFSVLEAMPLAVLTKGATIAAAFLFIVTSAVSAAYVLAMFSTRGEYRPAVRIKLAWGGVLAALAAVMVISDSVEAVRSVIALGAIPFVFVVLLLLVCFLRALRREGATDA